MPSSRVNPSGSEGREASLRTERLLIRWGILSTTADPAAATGRLDSRRRAINASLTLFFLLMVIKEACQSLRLVPSYLCVMGPVADLVSGCFTLGASYLLPIRLVLRHLESGNQVTIVTDLLTQMRQQQALDQRISRRLILTTGALRIAFCLATGIIAAVSLVSVNRGSFHPIVSLLILLDWGADAALFLTGFPSLIGPGILFAASAQDLLHRLDLLADRMRSPSLDSQQIDSLVDSLAELAAVIQKRSKSARLLLLIFVMTYLPLLVLLVAIPGIPFHPFFKAVVLSVIAVFALIHLIIYDKPAAVGARVQRLTPLMHGIQVRGRQWLSVRVKRRLLQAIEHASQETEPVSFTIGSLAPFDRRTFARILMEAASLSLLVVLQYSS